jgi:steroid delta-isomerase-like uncharacterized protein
MSSGDPETVVREFIDAFNAADWGRFAGTLAQAIVYSETGTNRQVEGADAYIDLCRGWKRTFPDVLGDVGRTAVDEDTVIQEVVWKGTHGGPLPTPTGDLDATGNHIEVAGCLWCVVSDGRIADIHHFLDVLAMLQQVGALSDATRA